MDQIISIRYILDSKVMFIIQFVWWILLCNIETLFKNFDWLMYDVVFFCGMLCSMLWFGVVWSSMVFCSVLFGNMSCYIVVECIQSVF